MGKDRRYYGRLIMGCPQCDKETIFDYVFLDHRGRIYTCRSCGYFFSEHCCSLAIQQRLLDYRKEYLDLVEETKSKANERTAAGFDFLNKAKEGEK